MRQATESEIYPELTAAIDQEMLQEKAMGNQPGSADPAGKGAKKDGSKDQKVQEKGKVKEKAPSGTKG